MTPRRTWPKADLLQQCRLALGLPLQPVPAPPLLSLVIKGGIGALVLVLLALLALLGLPRNSPRSSVFTTWLPCRMGSPMALMHHLHEAGAWR